MDALNRVVGRIQQIRDAEAAVTNLRDLLDAAWQQLLAEARPLPVEVARQPSMPLPETKSPDVLQFASPVANTGSHN
ncbi:hypothetical protein [Hydrogenophaga laconesensis]|uniref:Uncharacterized protein n=1 Tax=Hydrogenophaga laconesensis TaxID=1805971 RepID=A0ABU1VJR2_9BURK|nr:hypothetical protein [Hydrogenophaga laconesensis]MDR7097423.1 hypothetical protein [Hydrogenophaga laconesensis]